MQPELVPTATPSGLQPPLVAEASAETPALVFTSTNFRVWGKKSALSLFDQGLTSAAGFGVNVFLARWVPVEIYGAFAVAFAALLFISGFHNVLLLEPLSIFGPSRYAGRLREYFTTQLVIHTFLAGAFSVAAISAGLAMWWIGSAKPLTGAVLGGGVALPFLLLLWLARRMCYAAQRPEIAAIGSAFYLAFVIAGLFLLGHFRLLGSFTAFLLMACGGLLASGILIRLLGLPARESTMDAAISWHAALRENWRYGRWLVGSAILFSVSSQTQTFLVAASLGLGAAGILRAMQIPSLVMTQVVAATGLLVLPALSRDVGQGSIERMRHKAKLVSIALTCIALCFAALIMVEATSVGRLLYGGKYVADVWLMPFLALIPVFNAASMGFSMALRASQKPRFDLVANLIAAPVAIVSAFLFMRIWGLAGAAASMLLSFVVLSSVTITLFFRDSARERALSESSAEVAA
jgi:O-antigen/teichoic acid export membrane protein